MKRIGIDLNAPVTLIFLFLCAIALGLDFLSGGRSTAAAFSVYRSAPTEVLFYVRLFGHVLGHADFAHFSGNMMLFLLVAPLLEEKYGSRDFLVLIVGTALVTGLMQILLSPFALLGASGVVFSCICASGFVNLKKGKIPLSAVLVILLYLGQEAVALFETDTAVAHGTHLIGGVCGIVWVWLLERRKGRI